MDVRANARGPKRGEGRLTMSETPTHCRDPKNRNGSVAVVDHVDAGFLTLPQAARYLMVSSRTVRRWIDDRHLPHHYIGGPDRGRLLFRKEEQER